MPKDAPVNIGAPPDGTVGPYQRVSGTQAKLHLWAAADPGRRFDDLFNFVYDPATLIVAFDRVAGPDVDLSTEDVRDSQGRRITEDYARRAADYDPATVRRGRRSLIGGSTHSPRVSFRVPEYLRTAAEEAAAREGKSVSELAREALERYLAS